MFLKKNYLVFLSYIFKNIILLKLLPGVEVELNDVVDTEVGVSGSAH